MADRLVLMGYKDNGNPGGIVALDSGTLVNLTPQGNLNILMDSIGSDSNYYYSGSYNNQTRIYRTIKWTSTIDLLPINYGSQFIRQCAADDLDNYVYAAGDNYLVKYNKSNLTMSSFISPGNEYHSIAMDATYLYLTNNYGGFIDKRLRSDLSFVSQLNVNTLPSDFVNKYYWPEKVAVDANNIYFTCSGGDYPYSNGAIAVVNKTTFAEVGYIRDLAANFTGVAVSSSGAFLYGALPTGTGYTHYIHKYTNDPGLSYPDAIAPITTNTSWGNGLYFNGIFLEAGVPVPPDAPILNSVTPSFNAAPANTLVWS